MAKILIAEDERDIRELIEFTLTAYANHQVFKASNGAEAVELAPQVLPDLIMMDVRMPRMTGYEACRELKKIDSVKNIPVVFLSAKGQESEMDEGLDAGAFDYILKPFAPEQLATRVGEILQKFYDQQKAAAQSAATTITPAAPAPAQTATTPIPAASAPASPAAPAPATTTSASATPAVPAQPATPTPSTPATPAAPTPAPTTPQPTQSTAPAPQQPAPAAPPTQSTPIPAKPADSATSSAPAQPEKKPE